MKEHQQIDRRKFITESAKATGAALIITSPLGSLAQVDNRSDPITVGQIMDTFIAEVPGGAIENTVDTLKAGNRNIQIKGIVTTMFATIGVIKKSIALGANFIIAHEPTFYNHRDDTAWLEKDAVYQYKTNLLNEHQIAVWRCHDYIHSLKPDGVMKGVISQIGWEKYFDNQTQLATLPPVKLSALINHLKKTLGINMLRYVGDLNQTCTRVLVMPGAAGGSRQIAELMATKPDVLICGEIAEWETAEYVRDARAMGMNVSLVVLGHIASEEPGSEYMASWLKKHFLNVPVTHIDPGFSLNFM